MTYHKITNLFFEPQGMHDSGEAYSVMDVVTSPDGAIAYAALQDVPAGTPLTDASYWKSICDLTAVKNAMLTAADAANAAVSAFGDWAKQTGLRVRGEAATVTGNPVAFLADAGSLVCPVTLLEPLQAGQGDPDPENIRPISAHTSVSLTRSDTGERRTAEPAEPVYGGSVDWLTGVLRIDRALVALDGSENWKVSGTQSVEGYVRYDGKIDGLPPTASNACTCSHFLFREVNKPGVWMLSTSQTGVAPRISCAIPTLDEFKAYLTAQAAAGTPVQILYTLAEPVEIAFTPFVISAPDPEQEITLSGDGRIEATYVKPLRVTIDERIAAAQ